MAVVFCIIYANLIYSLNSEEDKKSLAFTDFREKIEEVSIQPSTIEKPDSNLVSFLVENVKEIFGDIEEATSQVDQNNQESTKATFTLLEVSTEPSNINKYIKIINDKKTNSNISNDLVKEHIEEKYLNNSILEGLNVKTELLNLTKELTIPAKQENEELKIDSLESYEQSKRFKGNTLFDVNYNGSMRRSCIFCNNIEVEHCSDPKNKLIPSTVCEQDEDLCYSQHTPFGLVDRGCFNINRNMTTFFCSCNLCNYIAISEMPHIFTSKKDWIENVQEMSRLRRLRSSVFKDMSCLRCEVNVTTKRGDIIDSTNCLDGNIGALPLQTCGQDEICAVKAVRSEGYIWRGCVSQPLYNYWWTLCDTDLCNYDALVSIFDKD